MGYSFLCPFAHSRDCQILPGAVIGGWIREFGTDQPKIFRLVGIGASGQCNGIPTGERGIEM